MQLHVTPAMFQLLADELTRNCPHFSAMQQDRRYRAMFGVPIGIVHLVWTKLLSDSPVNGGRPVHLLWTLMFLKVYASENVFRTIHGADEQTFRNWTWKFIAAIASIHVVSRFDF